jgi:hypothetical protein
VSSRKRRERNRNIQINQHPAKKAPTGHIAGPLACIEMKKTTKKENLTIFGISLPICFVLVILTKQILEKNFRLSTEFRFIYTYGSLFLIIAQFAIYLISFIIGIYIYRNRELMKSKRKVFSLIFLSLTPLLYLLIMFSRSIILNK